MDQDRHYMNMALELAAKARGRTSPNPMVGAVLVKDGEVVGKGFHAKAGGAHAEVVALADAGDRAKGATVYVTLEPCCHHGKTGPCTEALKKAGVKRVVAAMTDPNPLVAGKGLNILKDAGIEVVSGLLEEEAKELNEVFIKYITTKIPFIVLKAATSLDGKIATASGESKWITGDTARNYGHRLRDAYDAILVGVNTVLADDPSLTARLPEGRGKDPLRIIVDSMSRTPTSAKILTQESAAHTIIATTQAAPVERRASLMAAGAEVIVVPGEGPGVDLKKLMVLLGEKQISSVLIEGGGKISGSALNAGIVDKVAWFIAPKIIGGDLAPGPVRGEGIQFLKDATKLYKVTVQNLGADILITGYTSKGGDKISLLEL
ncbi:5-amino-6-(5-phosphoribosylamino)uracil reductase / diaminohydroxyphosphoribosylaminopyrimidine deaminase [Desulforamulus reducens MI-1]|uniref:Riboflavin biosynthesis protein RibD n=1 Tax=Desulforamulus reducens (strain ATCC BAA-1160 / DSM 100696 / MI-1) TaxID=349161 RepID=A4J6A7_DESRM|nr:bifunctional diaminohydroxyphosphoribosylaminopyrimidine deaminase/5-amino-6-(5-phosphoribosylamino)uracil reductase RibD [Desulforamulus reducens]ABO50610.1 5-amino-6-(5-phosphoribosylamino)uracil reductase / diaminohydroxyphosphoribosylaminopyrimidine deaminase [Desulforamulus reducens MI-1]